MSILPSSRPGASHEKVRDTLYNGTRLSTGITAFVPKDMEVAILNVRGYYRDTMGLPGVNDAGIYDDASFLVTPENVLAFNANTDPSVIGWNRSLGKPYAMLDEGVWYFIRGLHKGQYKALRQADPTQAKKFGIPNKGFFRVIRDDGKGRRYMDEGYHAINMHRGSNNGTSSWGCQTIPPKQYKSWQESVWQAMDDYKQTKIPVLLINGPIN